MRNRFYRLVLFPLILLNLQGPVQAMQDVSSPPQMVASFSSRLNQALSYYQAGDYDQAIAQWRALLNDPQAQSNPLLLGQLWNYLALSQHKLSQWEPATQSIQSSLEYLTPDLTQKMTPAHQQLYAQALTTQGQLYLELGNEIDAIETWKISEQLYRDLDDDIGIGGSLMNQALALEQGGFYRRACLTLLEAVQRESRCQFSETSLDSSPDIFLAFTQLESVGFQSLALHTFGKILLQLGELDLAFMALQMAQDREPGSSVAQQNIDFTQASLWNAQYQALKQEESRARSQRLAKRLQAKVIQQATQTQQKYEQLLQSFDSDQMIHYQTQVDYLMFLVDYLPWVEAKQGPVDVVRPLLQQQVEQLALRPVVDSSHRALQYAHIKQAEALIRLLQQGSYPASRLQPQILPLLQQVIQSTSPSTLVSPSGEAQTKAFAYGALGHYYEVQQQWSQAENATQRALSQSQSIQNAEVSYRWQWQLGRILAAQGQRDRAVEAYEQALIALQSIRQDLLSLKRDAQFSFRDQIEPSYRELVGLLLSSANPDNRSLTSARQVIDRLQVSEVEDFLLQNCINASLASLDAYIEQQAPESALLYTIVQPDYLDVMVKFPNSSQIQFHRVHQSQADLNAFLTTYRRSLQQKLPSTQRRSQAQGQQLYQWLVQPFQAEFQRQNIETLVFVLDGGLRDIPMATLHDGDRYLIEQYSVAVTPGLQVLEASRPSVTTQQRAVVAGASQGNQLLGLSALPAIRKEIQQIESALPQTDILLDNEFTEVALKNLIQAEAAPIIHIATHGQFSSDPDETFLVTGTGERIDLADLGELLRQRTRSQSQTLELLFLSACQTLAGDRWAALGMAGVAIRSGAQSTIASIWNADDEASAELVSRFYVHLTAQPGRTKAEALRLAQVEMLQNPRYELPVYWSPYVLIGNWQ